MESTPYVQPTRQRRRCQWRRSSENSLGHADLHATPDVLWGSQAPSGVQCANRGCLKTLHKCSSFLMLQLLPQSTGYGQAALCHAGTFGERLTAVDGCLGDWRPSEMHRQSRMELDSTIDMEDPLTSPPSPCARHPSMVGMFPMHSIVAVCDRSCMHCITHWCQALQQGSNERNSKFTHEAREGRNA